MGCMFSKVRRRNNEKAKITRHYNLAPAASCSKKEQKPYKSAITEIPARKCSQLYENLGQFSTLGFLAGEKELVMPGCLTYEGFHEFGYHIFHIDAEEYSHEVESMRADCIPGAISNLAAGERFLVVLKNKNGSTAFLPDDVMHVRKLYNSLCTWFGQQLVKIVFYKPSWYLIWFLEQSQETFFKFHFTSDLGRLDKLSGFPGEIKSR